MRDLAFWEGSERVGSWEGGFWDQLGFDYRRRGYPAVHHRVVASLVNVVYSLLVFGLMLAAWAYPSV
jgi:hypothetical protein